MNKIFKVIFNQATQSFVVVSELTRSKGKASSSTNERVALTPAALAVSAVIAGATLLGSSDALAAQAVATGTPIYIETGSKGGDPVLVGQGATASATKTNRVVAIGNNAQANDDDTIAIGGATTAGAKGAIAIGSSRYENDGVRKSGAENFATGINSIAIGANAQAGYKGANTHIGAGAIIRDGSKKDSLGLDAIHTNGSMRAIAIGDKTVSAGILTTAVGPGIIIANDSYQSSAFGYTSAVGRNSTTGKFDKTDFALALGASSEVKANSTGSIAVGAKSVVHDNTDGAIAMGVRAEVLEGARGATAIGLDAKVGAKSTSAVAVGEQSTISGDSLSSVAVGSSAQVNSANSSIAIGDNALVGNAEYTALKSIPIATGSAPAGSVVVAKKLDNGEFVYVIKGTDTVVGKKANTGVYWSKVDDNGNPVRGAIRLEDQTNFTKTALNATNSIAAGTRAVVTGHDTVAIGTDILVSTNNSVVLGAKSAEAKKEVVENAVVQSSDGNAYTYDSKQFAGRLEAADKDDPEKSGYYVSVGAKGAERQIKNVGAGKILFDSTDAINGSQLYAVVDHVNRGFQIQNQTKNVATITPNEIVNFNNGSLTAARVNTYNSTIQVPVYELDKTTGEVKEKMVDFTQTGTNITFDVETQTIDKAKDDGDDGKVTLGKDPSKTGDVTNSKPNPNALVTAQNVVDAINSAFWNANVTATKEEKNDFVNGAGNEKVSKIKAGDFVTFKAGKNIKVKKDGNTFIYATENNVTFDHMNATSIVLGNVSDPKAKPLSLTASPDGGLTLGKVDPKNPTQPAADSAYNNDKVYKDDGSTKAPSKDNPKDTFTPGTGGVQLNNVGWATKPDQAVNLDQLSQTVNKSGFYVKENGKSTLAANAGKTDDKSTEKVTPEDVVNFIDGANTKHVAKTTRNDATGQDTTTVQVNVVGLPVTYTYKDENGKDVPVAKVGDEYYPVDKNGNPITTKEDGSPADPIDAKTLQSNLVNPEAKPNEIGAPTKLGNVADALNTYPVEDKDGKKLVEVDGKFYPADKVNPETGKPEPGTEPATPAFKPKNDIADLDSAAPNQAVNVNDLKKLGWIVSDDKGYSEKVGNANEVKFIGTGLANVTGVTNATTGVREITVDVKMGEVVPSNEDFVKKDDQGNPTDQKVAKGDDGKFYPVDPKTGKADTSKPEIPADQVTNANNGAGLVTGNQVGDAIQKSGFVVGKNDKAPSADKFKNEAERVNPDDELRFADGKNTIVSLATEDAVDESGKKVTKTTVKVNVDVPVDYKYKDAEGKEVVKGADGKFYKPEDVKTDDNGNIVPKDGTVQPVTTEVTKDGAKLVNEPNEKPYGNDKVYNADGTPKAPSADNPKDEIVKGEGGVQLNNVGWAEKPDQAVNLDQLNQTVNKSGFYVKENGKSTLAANAGKTDDKSTEKVTPEDVVNFIDGANTKHVAKTTRNDATGQDTTTVQVNVVGLPVTYTYKDENGKDVPVAKVGDEYYPVDKNGNPITTKEDGSPADPIDAKTLQSNLVNPEAKPNEIGAPTKLGNVADALNTYPVEDKDGKKLVEVDGKFYPADKVNPETGKPEPGTEPATPAFKPKNDIADLDSAAPNQAVNVNDLKKLGWIVSDDKGYSEKVGNANEVKFIGTGLANVTGVTNATTGVREITVDVKMGEVVPSNEDFVKKDDQGNPTDQKVAKGDDGKFYPVDPKTGKADTSKPEIPADQVTNANNGAGLVTGNQVGDAIQKSGFVVGKNDKAPSADKFKNEAERVNPDDELRFADGKNTIVSLATEDAVDESGKKVTKTTVKVNVDVPVDYKYKDAEGKEVVKGADGKFYKPEDVKTDDNGNIVPKDGTVQPVTTEVTKDGAKLVNEPNEKPYGNDKVYNADGTPKAPSADNPKDEIVKGEGGVQLNNVGWAEKPDQAVNLDQLNQTVNKSGFYVKENGKSTLAANAGKTDDKSTEKVTPEDVVNFIDGANTKHVAKTTRNDATGQDTTTVQVNVVGLPVTYTYKDENGKDVPVAKVGDEYYPVDKNGNPITTKEDGSPADPIDAKTLQSNLVNPEAKPNEIGAPTKLGNVADALNTYPVEDKDGKKLVEVDGKFYPADKVNPETGKPEPGTEPATPAFKPKNDIADLDSAAPNQAVNVNDLKKLGWIVSDDKGYSEKVGNANEVKFIGTGLANVTGVTNATTGVREITVDVKMGEVVPSNEDFVKKDDQGNPTDQKVAKGDDGKFYPVDPKTGKADTSKPEIPADQVTNANNGAGLVTGNQVGDAIQKSGFVVGKNDKAPSADKFKNEAERVNPDDELRFADGKNTIVSLATEDAIDASGKKVTKTTVKVDLDLYTTKDAEGNPVAKADDGKFYPVDPATGKPDTQKPEVKPADVKTSLDLENQTGDNYAKQPDDANDPDKIVAGKGGVSVNNVAWAEKPDQAVNLDQLSQTVNKSGFFVKQNGVDTKGTNSEADSSTEKVTPNDVVNFVNGGNTKVTATTTPGANGQDTTNVQVNVVGLPVSFTDKDGNKVVQGNDGKFYPIDPATGAPDMEKPPVDSSTVKTQLVNPQNLASGTVGEPTKLDNVKDAALTPDSKEAVNGSQLYSIVGGAGTVPLKDPNGQPILGPDGKPIMVISTPDGQPAINLTDAKGNGTTPATVIEAVNKLNTEGTKYFKDNSTGEGAKAKAPESIAIGSGSVVEENAPKGSIALGQGSVAKEVHKDAGAQGHGLNDNTRVLSLGNGKDGAAAVNTQIQGVAPGRISATSTDAINGSQLHNVIQNVNQQFGNVNNRINKLDKDLRAGVAGSNAAAALPQVYIPGKSMVAASAGTFKGQNAIAVGYSRASDNGKLILKIQGNANSRGDFGAGVGVGYQW
ncbi:hypothetical protein A4G19_15335 [Pasteurellaceae bacterium Macca]|nr:hypothetical protein [Pasteurellaceae bacterium Macca]